MSQALCPPLGHTFNLRGKISSSRMDQFRITISRCNSAIDPTCANDTTFASIQSQVNQFTFALGMVNVGLNPESANYKNFYV